MFFNTLLRDCLLIFSIFGLAILQSWWKKKNIQVLQDRVVAEEVVEPEGVHEPSEASNDYDKLPDLNNMQQAMNIILEKSEDNMNEGDYLEVANKLKSFYTDVKKLESLVRESVPLYIRQDVIVENHLDYYQDISFKLSREELRTLMTGRIRERDIKIIARVKEYLKECCIELSNIRKYKKECWNAIQAMHNGLSKENLRIEHKKSVEAEKKKFESIRRQHEHLYMLETRMGHQI